MTTRRTFITGTTAVLAAAAPTAQALAQAVSGPSKFGDSGLVGRLEGPSQATATPTAFKEAPQLAELVKAGKLPPVAQRLPSEPLVLKPLESVGRYGGTWRRAFIGPSDGENGNRIMASDKLLFWDPTGSKIVPSVAKAYELGLLRVGVSTDTGSRAGP